MDTVALWNRVAVDVCDDVALISLLSAMHGDSRRDREQIALARCVASTSNNGLALLRAVVLVDMHAVRDLARNGFAPAIVEHVSNEMHPFTVPEAPPTRTPWWLPSLFDVAIESESLIWRSAARECVHMAARVPFLYDLDRTSLRAVLDVGVRDDDVVSLCSMALLDAYEKCEFEPAISALLRLWHERASTHALIELCILGYRLQNGGAIRLFNHGSRDGLTRATFLALKRRGGEVVAHAHLLATGTGCLLDFDASAEQAEHQLLCGPISRSVVDIMRAEDQVMYMRRRRPFLIRAAYASGKYLDDILILWVNSGLAHSDAEAYDMLALAGSYEPALNDVLQLRLSTRQAMEVANGIRAVMDPRSPEYSAAVVLKLIHVPLSYADVGALEDDVGRVIAHMRMYACPVRDLFELARTAMRALMKRGVSVTTIRRIVRAMGNSIEFVPAARTRASTLLAQSEFVQPACVICFEAGKAESVTLMPCKHRCVCLQCSLELETCPLCRSSVNAMRIWLAGTHVV